MAFVCPWENPSYVPGPTTFRPVAGAHQHGLEMGYVGTVGIICGHCRRCQTCGEHVPVPVAEPALELRLGGRAPGLYADGVRVE